MAEQPKQLAPVDTETAEHISELVGWRDPHYVPVRRDRSWGIADEVDLDSVSITQEMWSRPVHISVAVPDDLFGIGVRVEGERECAAWGREWRRNHIGIVAPDLDMVAGEGAAFFAMAFSRNLLQRSAEELGLDLAATLSRSSGFLTSRDEATERLRRELHGVFDNSGSKIARQEADSRLVVAVCEALSAPVHARGKVLDPTERFRLAIVARDYIEENLPQPLRLEDLTRATGANARRLQRAFGETFGMSPYRYLHASRLRLAQRCLRAADADAATVTEIAHACGLGHLGRFSVEYRKMFGECPSATLASSSRATAQVPNELAS